MTQFATGPTFEPDDTYRQRAVEAYMAADRFTQDALDWACTNAYRYADLVDAISNLYAFSPEFDTFVDDLLDGEESLA